MFVRLRYKDTLIICRSLFIFSLVIAIGITIADRQLNTLTKRQENIEIFNLAIDDNGIYNIETFNHSYSIKGIYKVAELLIKEKELVININDKSYVIPTYIYINGRPWFALMDAYLKAFIEVAFKFKNAAEFYLASLHQKIEIYQGVHR